MTKDSAGKRVRFAEGSRSAMPEFNLGNGHHSSADEYDSDVNAELEADITSSRRRGRRVNIDGYGSDASDQDEVHDLSDYSDDQDEEAVDEQGDDSTDTRRDRDIAMDGDDMFADDAGSSEQYAEKKRKRFLDLDDIEGQEMSSASRTEDANDDLDVARYNKGKQAERDAIGYGSDDGESGRGRVKIEAFNMKEDFEEGKFDASGNFVWNKQDPHAYQDDWLNDVSQSAIAQARESKAKRENSSLCTSADNDEGRWDAASDEDIIVEILNALRPRETVLTALARIGGPKQKSKNKWASKKGKQKGSVVADDGSDGGKEAERKRAIEHLTVLADQAMVRGMVNIYDDTYEQLVRQMRVAGRIPDDWIVGTPLQTSVAAAASVSIPNNTRVGLVEVSDELLDDLDELDPNH
ncbi:hypothetical protein H4R27_004342 [Coemansia aciculifera]|nr:hypothetical protein H4R27_004342 [Coemansia aciculifera]